MIIARVEQDGRPVWAAVSGDTVHELDGDVYSDPRSGRVLGSLASVQLRAPFEPLANKMVCLLSNWRGRDDRDGPGFFIKPPSCMIDPGEPIVYPPIATRVDFEAEIGVVIGTTCRNVDRDAVRAHVLGYTVCQDATAFETKIATNFDFLYGKSFDTFGVIGPWIQTEIEPDQANLRAWVNDELRCERNTADMIWNTDEVVSWISQVMTLNPGDVVSCGSPPEHSAFVAGDTVRVAIEGIGEIQNPVVAA